MTIPVVDDVEVAPLDHAHGLYGGLAATLTAVNPVLHAKQIGYATDTGVLKIGDGTTAWNDLPYYTASLQIVTWDGTGSPPARPVAGAPVRWECPAAAVGSLTFIDGDEWVETE